MTETTIKPHSERRGKLACECKTIAELKEWMGARWELVEPEKALEQLSRPDGLVRVRMVKK